MIRGTRTPLATLPPEHYACTRCGHVYEGDAGTCNDCTGTLHHDHLVAQLDAEPFPLDPALRTLLAANDVTAGLVRVWAGGKAPRALIDRGDVEAYLLAVTRIDTPCTVRAAA